MHYISLFIINPFKKIFRIELNVEFLQYLKVFFFKRLSSMMLFLILNQ